MSMYFCYYTFEASQHPKFLDEAINLLTQAQNKVSLQSGDVEILAIKVRQALEEAKPKGSTANVNKHTTDGEITINVYATALKDVTSVGRAYFKPVRAIVTYDLDDEDFIEVKLKMEEKKHE